LEKAQEQAEAKRLRDVAGSIDGGLVDAIGRAGGVLTGFSVKLNEYDVFMTLRVHMPAGPMIAFVGAETLSGVFLKATREALSDVLKFRVDKYARE